MCQTHQSQLAQSLLSCSTAIIIIIIIVISFSALFPVFYSPSLGLFPRPRVKEGSNYTQYSCVFVFFLLFLFLVVLGCWWEVRGCLFFCFLIVSFYAFFVFFWGGASFVWYFYTHIDITLLRKWAVLQSEFICTPCRLGLPGILLMCLSALFFIIPRPPSITGAVIVSISTSRFVYSLILSIHWLICNYLLGGARDVMVIVIGNGHGDTSSNPGRDRLHFIWH